MSKSIMLSEESLLVINNYNTNNSKLNADTYDIVLDFISNMAKFELSAAKMYKVYETAGLTPSLKMTSFKNRLQWNKGTFEEFELIGAKNFNKFCQLKSEDFGTDEFSIKLAEEKIKKTSESAKKKQDKEVEQKTNLQLREQNSLLFQSFKTSEKELFENLNKKDVLDLEQLKVYIDIMIKNKEIETEVKKAA